MADHEKDLVLITGGSGFVGMYCIIKCLHENYRVRTTVRSLKREADVRRMLAAGNASNLDDLIFVEADLGKDKGWADALKGCKYVLHVASPILAGVVKHEDELIVPAREGTLRVLRAAREAGVKRVVMTSSSSAIDLGHKNWDSSKEYTEDIWSELDGPGIDAYAKSRIIAERAAWKFIDDDGGDLQLAVVNPVLIFGPALGINTSPSLEVVRRLLSGGLPGIPNLSWSIVDVRDVADLHFLAMTNPKANGQRFIAASTVMGMKEMSLIIRKKLGKHGREAPTRNIPNAILKMMAWFDSGVALVVPQLGLVRHLSSEKSRRLLDWNPSSSEDSLLDTARSMIKLGLVNA